MIIKFEGIQKEMILLGIQKKIEKAINIWLEQSQDPFIYNINNIRKLFELENISVGLYKDSFYVSNKCKDILQTSSIEIDVANNIVSLWDEEQHFVNDDIPTLFGIQINLITKEITNMDRIFSYPVED